MALRMAMWVCQSIREVVSPPQNSISVTFCADIYETRLVNPDDIEDLLMLYDSENPQK